MEVEEATTEPKERILRAGIELFARQGYAATGLRELSARAEVNLAMVSYYFGSKRGLLEAIMQRYFKRHSAVIQETFVTDDPIEVRVRGAIRRLTELMREDSDLVRVTFTELPFDIPDAADMKAQHVRAMLEPALQHILPAVAARAPRPVVPLVFGPAVLGMLVFHFLFRPVLQRTFDVELDDQFYEQFPDQIANIFLYGILGSPPADVPFAKE